MPVQKKILLDLEESSSQHLLVRSSLKDFYAIPRGRLRFVLHIVSTLIGTAGMAASISLFSARRDALSQAAFWAPLIILIICGAIGILNGVHGIITRNIVGYSLFVRLDENGDVVGGVYDPEAAANELKTWNGLYLLLPLVHQQKSVSVGAWTIVRYDLLSEKGPELFIEDRNGERRPYDLRGALTFLETARQHEWRLFQEERQKFQASHERLHNN